MDEFIKKYNLDDSKFFNIKNYITILYEIEVNKKNAYIKEQKINGITNPEYHNKKISSYTYVYAEIYGSNLTDLFQHPDVDKKYSITNNIKEVLKIFDIETARNVICIFCDRIIRSNGSYINGRHISFLADFMTNSGTIIPITSKGIARTNRGVFADASFEQPIDFFIKSALIGKKEKSNFTSTSIFMGKRMSIGTGSLLLKLNPIAFKYLDSLYTSENISTYNNTNEAHSDLFLNTEEEKVKINFTDNNGPNFNKSPDIKQVSKIPDFLSEFISNNDQLISEESIRNFLKFKF